MSIILWREILVTMRGPCVLDGEGDSSKGRVEVRVDCHCYTTTGDGVGFGLALHRRGQWMEVRDLGRDKTSLARLPTLSLRRLGHPKMRAVDKPCVLAGEGDIKG